MQPNRFVAGVLAVVGAASFILACPAPETDPQEDAGQTEKDAGGNTSSEDAGSDDAGDEHDAGIATDAGEEQDAGTPDGGAPDASIRWDGGIWQGYDAGPAVGEVVCSPTRWCFSHPFPHGLRIDAIVPDGPAGGVWMASPPTIGFMSGSLLHYKNHWARAPLPYDTYLPDIAPVYPDARSGELIAPRGRGTTGEVMRFDGANWSTVLKLPTYPHAAWSFDDQNAMVVGNAGLMAYVDGGSWVAEYMDGGVLRDVWGTAPNDLWAVGGATVRHFDGTNWQLVSTPVPPPGASINSVSGTAPDNVWFAGGNWYGSGFVWRWDGTQVQEIAITPRSLNAVAVRGPNQAWAVGRFAIYEWDGTSLKQVVTSKDDFVSALVHGPEMWAGGYEGEVVRIPVDGGQWRTNQFAEGGLSLLAISPTELLGFGSDDGELMRWTPDAGWQGTGKLTSSDGGTVKISQAWGTSSSNLIVAAGTRVYHWDGNTWTERSTGTNALAVHGSDPNNVWVVGQSSARWDGTAWTEHPLSTNLFHRSVWAASPTEVWAANGANVLWRWNGTAWSWQDINANDDLNAVWGFSSNDLWAVGAGGGIYHYDGTTWTRHSAGTTMEFTTVHGSAPNNVWAAGNDGIVAHWDGNAWTSHLAVQYDDYVSVQVLGPNDVFVSNWRDPAVLRYRP